MEQCWPITFNVYFKPVSFLGIVCGFAFWTNYHLFHWISSICAQGQGFLFPTVQTHTQWLSEDRMWGNSDTSVLHTFLCTVDIWGDDLRLFEIILKLSIFSYFQLPVIIFIYNSHWNRYSISHCSKNAYNN